MLLPGADLPTKSSMRRVTEIAKVEKELRDSRPWCSPVFRFDESSQLEAPRCERMGEVAAVTQDLPASGPYTGAF
jgi:hypothetical protein